MQYLSRGDGTMVDGRMKTVLCKRQYDGKDGTVLFHPRDRMGLSFTLIRLIFVTIHFAKPKSKP
jgi:hypothetical protein